MRQYTALRVIELAGEETFETDDLEVIVLPLAGSCRVVCDGQELELQGRDSVFSRVTDFAYLPRDAHVEIKGEGRFALPGARCGRRLPFRYGPAEAVPVELRGGGPVSRQVNNFCSVAGFEADRLIACELLTPGGCWSSYPPHKHDEERPGVESSLEEIYYYEVAHGGFAFQRVYGSTEVLTEIRTGDMVDVPHGWHGPAIAAPGYDLYYLNVMAGPGTERVWIFSEDPAHAWTQETWKSQPMHPRLPMTSASGCRSAPVGDPIAVDDLMSARDS
jgi:5-deoxy-glucuronate isomerase